MPSVHLFLSVLPQHIQGANICGTISSPLVGGLPECCALHSNTASDISQPVHVWLVLALVEGVKHSGRKHLLHVGSHSLGTLDVSMNSSYCNKGMTLMHVHVDWNATLSRLWQRFAAVVVQLALSSPELAFCGKAGGYSVLSAHHCHEAMASGTQTEFWNQSEIHMLL